MENGVSDLLSSRAFIAVERAEKNKRRSGVGGIEVYMFDVYSAGKKGKKRDKHERKGTKKTPHTPGDQLETLVTFYGLKMCEEEDKWLKRMIRLAASDEDVPPPTSPERLSRFTWGERLITEKSKVVHIPDDSVMIKR